jgi:hypothetical protein
LYAVLGGAENSGPKIFVGIFRERYSRVYHLKRIRLQNVCSLAEGVASLWLNQFDIRGGKCCGLRLGGWSHFLWLHSQQRRNKKHLLNRRGFPTRVSDEALLSEIEQRAFDFFWSEASATTGQVKDRASQDGKDARKIASIAATGFGLSGLCIGHARDYRNKQEIVERVRATLQFLWHKLPHEHGFYYHFIDMNTGAREWQCEISSIDTSILLCGVLTARQHFADAEIQDLATKIYERVDWPWMLNRGETLSMGWHPGEGFLKARWEHYCELMMIYLLAMGSPTHPIRADTWDAWTRPTEAHKLFCLSLREEFPDYSDHLWGITASDSFAGYQAWGGPPPIGKLDGSVVPCATRGSLPFLYPDCMRVLRRIRERYRLAWGRYGFVDAFNPLTNWYDPDVLGIDLGITMLMAENHRTGFVWKTFMKNKEAQRGMELAGLRAQHAVPAVKKAARPCVGRAWLGPGN